MVFFPNNTDFVPDDRPLSDLEPSSSGGNHVPPLPDRSYDPPADRELSSSNSSHEVSLPNTNQRFTRSEINRMHRGNTYSAVCTLTGTAMGLSLGMIISRRAWTGWTKSYITHRRDIPAANRAAYLFLPIGSTSIGIQAGAAAGARGAARIFDEDPKSANKIRSHMRSKVLPKYLRDN